MTRARRGIVFVVSAPSGTGKTTVCRSVIARDPGIRFSISHTTRAPRPGERDGVDYFFVDAATFRSLVGEGAFVEYAEYGGNLYGTSWKAAIDPLAQGTDVLLEIDIQGARQVADRAELGARLIFLLPPSRAALEARLRNRGTDAPDVIERRLAIAEAEFQAVYGFDYVVVNDALEAAVADVLEIVRAERAGDAARLEARFGRSRVLARLGPRLGLAAAP
ncbi:MAG: guanylate kinase [Deltaproteobacteria bacterium]|nr:MAG: guanylate kinase [Deltaproteobacteria bacterium]